MTTDITLVGGPTVRFSYAGLAILTDPTFDPPGPYDGRVTLHKLVGPAVPREEIGAIDVVLLSHDQHADNLDRIGRELLSDVPKVVTEAGAATRIQGSTGLGPWETLTLDAAGGTVSITAVPALHGPPGCEAITGLVTGFVLEAEGLPTTYVSGDNASVAHVEDIASRFTIDVAFLFVGAANVGAFGDEDITLNRRTAVAAARVLGSAVVIPVHADGWDHFTETRESLGRAFEYAGLEHRLMMLQPGVVTQLPSISAA